jgi:arginase family enzyme
MDANLYPLRAVPAYRDQQLQELTWLLRPAGAGLYLVSAGAAAQRAWQRQHYGVASNDELQPAFLRNLERVVDAQVLIMAIPSDVGAGFRRGANLGPQALRERLPAASLPPGVVDIGDVFVVPQLSEDEILRDEIRTIHQDAIYPDVPIHHRRQLPVSPLSIATRAWQLLLALNPRAKPFTIGGDHSCAWPAVHALHASGRRFCIVQVDAHTDLMAHRMGVRMCFATWSYHANELIGRQQRLLQVGIRATRYPRQHWEQSLDVRQWWPAEFGDNHDAVLDEIVRAAKATGLPCFFSNDIDGTDIEFADATGTPEAGGLSPAFVDRLIQRLGTEVGLVAGDIMEVAPLLGGPTTLDVASRYCRLTLNGMTNGLTGSKLPAQDG